MKIRYFNGKLGKDVVYTSKKTLPEIGELVTVKMDNRGGRMIARCLGYSHGKGKAPTIVLAWKGYGPHFLPIRNII